MPRLATSDRPHHSIQPTFMRDVETRSNATALVRVDDFLSNSQKESSDSNGQWELSPLEESFRHGFWRARRSRVFDALKAAYVSPRRLINFANCGANAYVVVEQTSGQIGVEASHCHDRLCQACGQARAARLQLALADRVPKAKCLHVVLTLKSSDEPLGQQLTRLYKSASKMRARKWWQSRVAGGMASLELTRNASSGRWHPHLHCLVHAEWLDQAELSSEWKRATGDSSIVHVSLVSHHAAAIREVTKYVTKPVHRSIDFQPESLVELIKALHGRHLVATFGTWRADPLLADDPDREMGSWKKWGTLNMLHAAASAGDEWAKQALLYLTSLAPGRDRRPAPTGAPPG